MQRKDQGRPASRELVLACKAGTHDHIRKINKNTFYADLPAGVFALVELGPKWSELNPDVTIWYFDNAGDRDAHRKDSRQKTA